MGFVAKIDNNMIVSAF